MFSFLSRKSAEPPRSLFFVHVPKTAGTSFRQAVKESFDPDEVLEDYGVQSPSTSALIAEMLYEEPVDFWRFISTCKDRGVRYIGGHVPCARFLSVFGATAMVTFLRDPLQRIASEYSHFVRRKGYEGSFRDFYDRPLMQDRQSKLLRGVDLEAIGMLGITERYADGLVEINSGWRLDMALRSDNVGRERPDVPHAIDPADQERLEFLNQRDIALYQHVAALFDERRALSQAGHTWAHARMTELKPQRVVGWAWWSDADDRPVEVEVWVDGACTARTVAVDFRPGLCNWKPPRGGYVGFQVRIRLKPGQRVQCRVAATGQYFPLAPAVVPDSEKA